MRIGPWILLGMVIGIAARTAVPAPAVAGEPIFTITACDQVEFDGRSCPRFTFQVLNTSAGGICQVFLELGLVQGDPGDTCTFLSNAGPQGWQAYVQPSRAGFLGCPEGIEPGQTVEGFQLVMSRACCVRGMLANDNTPVVVEDVCLQCPTPAHRATWGVIKVVYR